MNKIKKWLWPMVSVFLIISVSLNVRNQLITLIEAQKKNNQLREKIEKIEKENQILIKKIEYATSSAFREEERHDKLALGRDTDVWLVLGEEKEIDLRPKINEDREISNYRQWLNLFTR
jgi:hypothetical protein